jgi:3-oxoacyl-[acyl-carrier protein] reductase
MAWSNQVAVVTGGSRGLGRAAALALARHGAAVCVNYAGRAEAAEAVAGEIRAAGGRAIAVAADVADAGAVAAMIGRAEAELGPVSILVNNAGISLPMSFDSFDAAQLDRMRRINVDGVIHATRAVMAGMRERRYGRIVNIASIAALATSMPGTTFYAATKAEVVVLTRRAALELGPHGITVNAIAPGFIRTDMTQGGKSEDERVRNELELASRAMVRRIGEPDDIGHAVAFLAAPEAGFITAQLVTVDGGRMDYIGHG